MLDSIVSELASRFGLGEQAAPLAQGALAYIIKADHGGLSGFIGKFEAAGLGSMAHSWLGGPDGAQNISPAQLETVLGNKGGLISQLVASTGVARQSVTPALGYLLPALVGVLTPEGSIPTSLPPEVAAFAAGQASRVSGALGAIASNKPAQTVEGTGAAMMRWIPWLVLVALALGVLGWCSQKPVSQDAALSGASSTVVAADQANAAAAPAAPASASADAASAAEPAAAPASTDAASAAPLGAGVLAEMEGDKPMLKIYFDVSRAQIAPEFAQVAADLLAYLKEHGEAKVHISGYNDPTGNAVQNAKLSKQRALAVQAALKAQGVPMKRMELIKPTDGAAASAAGANNAELRRVEVRVR